MSAYAAPAELCYGLVVGISEYQDPNIPKLKFTGADAQAFYDQLVAPEQSGFPPGHSFRTSARKLRSD